MSKDLVTQLFGAIYAGDENLVVGLLRAGASPEATDNEGQTPLYLASVQNEPGIARLLLAAGADPSRLSSGTDLPLCGAACGGHTEVVHALLAAGARPDATELLGFTALAWSVQLGHAPAAEALLAAGADPDLAVPGGRPPLVAAARRGSLDTVKALLRHGASELRPALDEARRWLGREDLVAEVARELAQNEAPDTYETVVRRVAEGEGITLVVELLRDGGTWTGREQQTGHGAIATLLEHELGLRTPFGELLDRALPFNNPENENWLACVAELQRRADEVTFQAAAALTRSPDVRRRTFAVDVLAQLGFKDRTLGLLRPLCEAVREAPSGAEGESELLQSLLLALAHQGHSGSVDEVVRHAGHPEPAVRRRVAFALHSLAAEDDPAATDALIALAGDPDSEVRDWATTGLARTPADATPVREALAARLDDPDPTVAAEAAQGLARRQDPRAVAALARLLSDADPDSYAYATAHEAIDLIEDERARHRLRGTAPRG